MTRLLVSVRDADEAQVALQAGADLIDVKEPRRGSLGPADPEQIAEVVAVIDGQAPVSAALGELLSGAIDASRVPCQLQFAKLGLSGCAGVVDWQQRWTEATEALPPGVQNVAVVYADWRSAQAPPPGTVLRHAIGSRCAAVLVDTFDKSQGGLLKHWPLAELATFAAAVRDARLLLVLAGSLTHAEFPALLPLEPDYLAVRGAACRRDRTSQVDGARIERLTRLLK